MRNTPKTRYGPGDVADSLRKQMLDILYIEAVPKGLIKYNQYFEGHEFMPVAARAVGKAALSFFIENYLGSHGYNGSEWLLPAEFYLNLDVIYGTVPFIARYLRHPDEFIFGGVEKNLDRFPATIAIDVPYKIYTGIRHASKFLRSRKRNTPKG